MTTFTTAASLAAEYNEALDKFLLNPDAITDVVITPVDHSQGNTQLTITIDRLFGQDVPDGISDYDRFKVKTKFIHRTPINTLPGTFTIDGTAAETIGDLLPAINTAMGLSLTLADIVDGPVPAELPDNVVLTIDPNNLVYTGSVTFLAVVDEG